MDNFQAFLKLGFEHILDPQGYDHILFVVVLCVLYSYKQWKNILILVTAFTLGHSLTLALAALDKISFNPSVIETMIPITIILTALYNIIVTIQKKSYDLKIQWNYLLALGFGLIHGLGFSNYFKAILGKEANIVQPLFAFNLGVELGQICVVVLAIGLGSLATGVFKVSTKNWTLFISSLAILASIHLLFG